MKLLLIRHAESEGNASGNYSTAQSDSLSATGLQQADALANTLQSWSFDKIISSPLQRAMQTIMPYLQATGQKAEIWPEAAEACWHDEREPCDDRWYEQPASLPHAFTDQFIFRDGNAIRPAFPETFAQGLCRVQSALQILETVEISHETVLMVTHGHFIREILNLMLRVEPFQEFPHVNCGITSVLHQRTWELEFTNKQELPHEGSVQEKDYE